jgi:hypothetical protein
MQHALYGSNAPGRSNQADFSFGFYDEEGVGGGVAGGVEFLASFVE